jgi:hypothetical protein
MLKANVEVMVGKKKEESRELSKESQVKGSITRAKQVAAFSV